MKEIEETTTPAFGDLFGNRTKYIVPKFQRDYSWGEEEWNEAKIDSRQSEMAKNAVNIWKINWFHFFIISMEFRKSR